MMRVFYILSVFLLNSCGHMYCNHYESDSKFNKEEFIKNGEGIVVFSADIFRFYGDQINISYLSNWENPYLYKTISNKNSKTNVKDINNIEPSDDLAVNSTNVIKAKAGKYVLSIGLFFNGILIGDGTGLGGYNFAKPWYKPFTITGVAHFELKPGEVIYIGKIDYEYSGQLIFKDDFKYIQWRLGLGYSNINKIIEKRLITVSPLPKECDFFNFYNTDYYESRKTYPKKDYNYENRINKVLTLDICKPKLLELLKNS